MNRYIPLSEYVYKYKVSVQEIRKKIEFKQLEFIFSDFEYLIKDEPFEQHYQIEETLPLSLREAEEVRKLNQELEKTLSKLENTQQENLDLKNLCQFLENENRKLKEIILGNQRIETWMESKS